MEQAVQAGTYLIDKLMTVIAFVFPFTTVPQLYNVWVLQNAAGVSLITWMSYLVLSIPLLVYSFAHEERPLVIMYTLWVLVHISMVVGTMLYGQATII